MATLTANPTAVPGLDRPIQDAFPDGFAQNGGRISTDHVGMLRPTPASLSIEEMRERLKQDGYLFVKGLLPREDVLDAREQYGLTTTCLSIYSLADNNLSIQLL